MKAPGSSFILTVCPVGGAARWLRGSADRGGNSIVPILLADPGTSHGGKLWRNLKHLTYQHLEGSLSASLLAHFSMDVSSRRRRCADIARLSTSHGMIWGAGIKAFPNSVNRKQNQEKTSISRCREARLVIRENKYKCSHFSLACSMQGQRNITNTNTHALTVALELTRKRQPH